MEVITSPAAVELFAAEFFGGKLAATADSQVVIGRECLARAERDLIGCPEKFRWAALARVERCRVGVAKAEAERAMWKGKV
jgi:hypothetical protein